MNTIQVTTFFILIQIPYLLTNPSLRRKNQLYHEFDSHFEQTFEVPKYYPNVHYNECPINNHFAMYANVKSGCQTYFICHSGRKDDFTCPEGTLFDEDLMTCDFWYRVNCISKFRSSSDFYPKTISSPRVYSYTPVQEDYEFDFPVQTFDFEPPNSHPINLDHNFNTKPTFHHNPPSTSNIPTPSSFDTYEPELTTKKDGDHRLSTNNSGLEDNYYFSEYDWKEPEWTFAWIKKPKPFDLNDNEKTKQNFEFDLTNQYLNPKLKETGKKETKNSPNPWLFSKPQIA